MSYDNPFQIDYSFTGLTVATPPTSRYLRVPYTVGLGRGNGAASTSIRFARIREIAIDATTAVTGNTLAPRIQIGTASTVNKYCVMKVGVDAQATALAAPGAWGFLDYDGLVAQYANRIDLLNDGDTVGTLQGFLNCNFVANSGGSPAGVIDVSVSIQWF